MPVASLLQFAMLAIGILNLALLLRLSRRLRRQARSHAVLIERLLGRRGRLRPPSASASAARSR
jgi:membrane protein implicated in regulation of membrane protease activity